MTTFTTKTIAVTIDAPFDKVAPDLAEPFTHLEWGAEFFAGPVGQESSGGLIVHVSAMGGDVQYRVETDLEHGIFDVFIAPLDGHFGPPLPVRLLRNGDGVDVLWTLIRFTGMPNESWEQGIAAMEMELHQLKQRPQG
ncbi:MAG: hypothetical protein MK524_17045 [SAR202 cluster bacterium]|jgi:hypothetical protein|nr:hypothetical protein [SAR202 cluster bacterium]